MVGIFAFVIVSLVATCGLAFIYAYLYLQERERYLALWCGGWCLYVLRLVFQLWSLQTQPTPGLTIAEQLANLASGFFLMGGTYSFLGRRLWRGWPVLFLAGGAWIIVATFWSVAFSLLMLPTFLFLGIVFAWTGVELLRSPRLAGLGKSLAGWAFILWGLHKLDYPVLRPVEWFAPWGYLLSSILEMAVALGILLVFFERTRAELGRREARLRAILDNAALGIGLVDPQGRFLQVNSRWAEMLGYTETELAGLTPGQITHPEDRACSDALFQALVRGETGDYRLEKRFLRKDGSLFWGDLTVSPLRGSNGQLEAVIGMVMDITARKAAQLDLQHSQRDLQRKTEQLEQLLETARRMTGSLELTQVLAQIGQSAREFVEADGCSLYRLEADGQTLTPLVAVDPLYEAEILAAPLQVSESFTGQAVTSRCARVFNDAGEQESGFQIPGTPQHEHEHIMVAPLLGDGQVLGAMCINRTSSRPFDAGDLALAETFAAYASLAFKNAQAHASLQSEVEDRRRAEALLAERSEQLAGAYLQLQESEARYRSLYEDSPISLWVEDFSGVKAYLDELRRAHPEVFDGGPGGLAAYLDAHPEVLRACAGRVEVVDVNRATLSLYSAGSKAELLGGLPQVFDDDTYLGFQRAILAVAEGCQQLEYDTSNRTLAGKRLHLSLHWAVLPGYETSYARVLVSLIDRTERQRAEQSLQESQNRYRSLFEDSPVSLWEQDYSGVKAYLDELRRDGLGEPGGSPEAAARDLAAFFEAHPEALRACAARTRVLDVNRATLKLYGAEKEYGHLLGKEAFNLSMDQIFTEQDYPAYLKTVLAVAAGESQVEFESASRTLDGRKLAVNLQWSVPPDSRETYSRVLVSVVDITEHKRAEDAIRAALAALQASEVQLRESEARYRSLFEDNGSIMLLIEPSTGRIVDANAAACQYYGYDRPAMTQMHIAEVNALAPESLPELEQARRQKRTHYHLQHRLAGGQVRHVEVYSGPIHLDGRELLYNIIHDITARVQREREMGTIATVTAALRPATTRAEMLPVIVDQVRDLLAANGAAILLRDPATGEGVFERASGLAEPVAGARVPPGEGIGGLVLASGQPYLNNDARSDPRAFARDQLPPSPALAAVPLSTREETFGALLVAREAPFTDADLRLLVAVGEIAASAIHRQSLTDRTLQQARNMAAVSALGRRLSETLDLEQIYTRLAEAVRDLVPDVATLFVSRYEAERQLITAAFGLQDGQRVDVAALPAFPLAPPGQGTQSEVIHTRQPLIVPDLPERGARRVLVGSTQAVTQSAVYVPLLARGQILGVFQVQSYIPNRFTEADADLLSIVANTAAIAMQNAELFAETGRRLQRLDALHNIDKAITTHYDLDLTLQVVLDQVTAQLNVDAAALLLLEAPGQSLALRHCCGFRTGPPHAAIPLGRGLAGQVALERRALLIPDLPAWLSAHVQKKTGVLLAFEAEGFVAYLGVPLIAKGQVKGVLELFHRAPLEPDAEWSNFLDTLARQAAIAVEVASLFGDLQRSNQELTLTFDTTLEGWAKALELRDLETENHSQRVVGLAVELARRMGLAGEALVHLRRGALLHDIGKMGIPDSILFKPGRLDPAEWEIMRQHPVNAYQLLAPIPFLHPALEIPYCHHEKWDGSGYPRGLKGETIPLAARIFAVVDVWDALLEKRPYRDPWTKEAARAYIQEQAGVHFDPRVVAAFFQLLGEAPPTAPGGRRMTGNG